MPEKLEIIPGSIIEVDSEPKKEALKFLCTSFDQNKNLANILMNEAAKKYDASEKEFWKAIHAMFPEFENWAFAVKGHEGKLIVTRPLTIAEKEKRDKRLEDGE